MKLRVIGFWGGYPNKDEASAMYVLEKDDFLLVIDVGSGGLLKFMKYYDVTDIDAVLLSHYHADHIADVGVLQHALLVERYITDVAKTVPFYGHNENEDQFNRLNSDDTEATAYKEDDVLKIGPFFIRFLRTVHSVPCFGMRITDGEHTLVYTADTAYQDEWIKFSRNADLLLTECNFYAGQDATVAGHLNSDEVGKIADQAAVKEVILTHLPHFGNPEDLVGQVKQHYDGPVSLAYEGLTWQGKRDRSCEK